MKSSSLENVGRAGELHTVARASIVLEAFLDQDRWGVTNLARYIGMKKSVVHRLLATLAGTGLLAIEPTSSTYILGPLMNRLGERAIGSDTLVRAAKPFLNEIVGVTRETANLAIVSGTDGICVDCVDSPQAMRMTYNVGTRFPLHAGAIGRALLAFQNDDFVERYLSAGPLPSLTPRTITKASALRTEISRTRARGFARSDGEITPGAASIAVPVWGNGADVVAAIALSAPAFRLKGTATQEAVAHLLSVSEALSRSLGHCQKKSNQRLSRKGN